MTYNAAISTCGSGQQWQSALQLLREMRAAAARAGAVAYCAAISAHERG